MVSSRCIADEWKSGAGAMLEKYSVSHVRDAQQRNRDTHLSNEKNCVESIAVGRSSIAKSSSFIWISLQRADGGMAGRAGGDGTPHSRSAASKLQLLLLAILYPSGLVSDKKAPTWLSLLWTVCGDGVWYA